VEKYQLKKIAKEIIWMNAVCFFARKYVTLSRWGFAMGVSLEVVGKVQWGKYTYDRKCNAVMWKYGRKYIFMYSIYNKLGFKRIEM